MGFDLIIGTKNRFDELDRLLESLRHQTYRDFKVWICDQNSPEFLAPLIEKYQDLDIVHEICEFNNLSQARNQALDKCQNEYFAFPDDDCTYDNDVLAIAADFFQKNPPYDVIFGSWLDFGMRVTAEKTSEINRYNCLYRAGTFLQFFRRTAITEKVRFDLNFGFGGKFIGSEDSDFVLAIFVQNIKGCRLPQIKIHHRLMNFSDIGVTRMFQYGHSRMVLLKKYQMPCWFIACNLFFPFFRMITNPRKFKYYSAMLRGRISGMLVRRSQITTQINK